MKQFSQVYPQHPKGRPKFWAPVCSLALHSCRTSLGRRLPSALVLSCVASVCAPQSTTLSPPNDSPVQRLCPSNFQSSESPLWRMPSGQECYAAEHHMPSPLGISESGFLDSVRPKAKRRETSTAERYQRGQDRGMSERLLDSAVGSLGTSVDAFKTRGAGLEGQSCNPSTWGQGGITWAQEFKTSLDNIARPCFKKRKNV